MPYTASNASLASLMPSMAIDAETEPSSLPTLSASLPVLVPMSRPSPSASCSRSQRAATKSRACGEVGPQDMAMLDRFMRGPRDFESLTINYARIHDRLMPQVLLDEIIDIAWRERAASNQGEWT